MKSKTIVKAFDSINPSQAQKDRMLQEILRQMPEQPRPTKRMDRNTYVTEPVKHSRRSFIPAIAACLAVCVLGGLGIGMLKNGQSVLPSSAIMRAIPPLRLRRFWDARMRPCAAACPGQENSCKPC